jgi:hypothetical protein
MTTGRINQVTYPVLLLRAREGSLLRETMYLFIGRFEAYPWPSNLEDSLPHLSEERLLADKKRHDGSLLEFEIEAHQAPTVSQCETLSHPLHTPPISRIVSLPFAGG